MRGSDALRAELYPAITRLEAKGHLERRPEPGAGAAPRQVLELTAAGRAELARRLREPTEVEITDRNRYFTILAFLHRLEDPEAQAAVLRRRLAFLDAPGARFFLDADGEPVKSRGRPDPLPPRHEPDRPGHGARRT